MGSTKKTKERFEDSTNGWTPAPVRKGDFSGLENLVAGTNKQAERAIPSFALF
jgi:hypothetical protein